MGVIGPIMENREFVSWCCESGESVAILGRTLSSIRVFLHVPVHRENGRNRDREEWSQPGETPIERKRAAKCKEEDGDEGGRKKQRITDPNGRMLDGDVDPEEENGGPEAKDEEMAQMAPRE